MKKFIFGVFCVLFSCTQKDSQEANVPPYQIQRGEFERTFFMTGETFSPQSQLVSYKQVLNSIWAINVEKIHLSEGSFVKEGDVLLSLSKDEIEKEIKNNEANVEKNDLSIDNLLLQQKQEKMQLEYDLKEAQINLQKAKLDIQGGVSVSKLENQKNLLEVSQIEWKIENLKKEFQTLEERHKNELEMRKSEQKNNLLRFKNAQEALEKIHLKAPRDGIVSYPSLRINGNKTPLREGVSITPGTNIAEISPSGNLMIRVRIPEVDILGIEKGTPCEMSLDVSSQTVYPCAVETVGRLPQSNAEREGDDSLPGDFVKTIEVIVAPKNLPENIFPGMSAKVTFYVFSLKNTLKIPSALLMDEKQIALEETKKENIENTENKNPQETPLKKSLKSSMAKVWMTDAQGKKGAFVDVKIGQRSLAFAEVLEGLKEGDFVAFAPSSFEKKEEKKE